VVTLLKLSAKLHLSREQKKREQRKRPGIKRGIERALNASENRCSPNLNIITL
jgi:hypothetical protein